MRRAVSAVLVFFVCGALLAAATPSLTEMDGLAQKALDAIDSNHLAEAIRAYVSILALADGQTDPAVKAKADAATAELAKIAGRLTLEPSTEWFDKSGAQLAGDTRSLGKQGALSPSVYLFENFGSGKSPVGDASIYFEFVKGSGAIVNLVSTDAYGKANTTIAKLDEPGKNAVIRAYPLFRARGMTYAFKTVFRDFTYLPPANVARVVLMESYEKGTRDDPQAIDAVIAALKPAGLQLAPFSGTLAPDAFKLALGGDAKGFSALGLGAGTPYAVFVDMTADPAAQVSFKNPDTGVVTLYNMFKAIVRPTLRIIRSDGTVVSSLVVPNQTGQGNSAENAYLNAFKLAKDAVVAKINSSLDAITDALTKD